MNQKGIVLLLHSFILSFVILIFSYEIGQAEDCTKIEKREIRKELKEQGLEPDLVDYICNSRATKNQVPIETLKIQENNNLIETKSSLEAPTKIQAVIEEKANTSKNSSIDSENMSKSVKTNISSILDSHISKEPPSSTEHNEVPSKPNPSINYEFEKPKPPEVNKSSLQHNREAEAENKIDDHNQNKFNTHNWQISYGLVESIYQESDYTIPLSGYVREIPHYYYIYASGWFVGITQQQQVMVGKANINEFQGTLNWEQDNLLAQMGYQIDLFETLSLNAGILGGWSESRLTYEHYSKDTTYFSDTTKQGKPTYGGQISGSIKILDTFAIGLRYQELLQKYSINYEDAISAIIHNQKAYLFFIQYSPINE